MEIEKLVLYGLLNYGSFLKIFTFLRDEYFQEEEKEIFRIISQYLREYSRVPRKTELLYEIQKFESEEKRKELKNILQDIYSITDVNEEWLLKKAEEFCRNKAIYFAILKSISIYDGSDTTPKEKIPEILRNAISISIDESHGIDFFEDVERRYNYYVKKEEKIPFDIEILNKITNGGCPRKTLNIVAASVHSGKTAFLSHLACSYLKKGYNVLYITLEMSELEILRRIDANILDIGMNEIRFIEREAFKNRVEKIKEKTRGKLKVKEYPTGLVSVEIFRSLLEKLEIQQEFIPDVLIVDYLGIVSSSRLRMGQYNSYFFLKSVSEELRALSVEKNIVLWTAIQLNRKGMMEEEPDMTSIAESIGIAHTADFLISLIRNDDLDAINQVMMYQWKNRYGNKTFYSKFFLGADFDKQRFYDVDETPDEKEEKVQKQRETIKKRKREKEKIVDSDNQLNSDKTKEDDSDFDFSGFII